MIFRPLVQGVLLEKEKPRGSAAGTQGWDNAALPLIGHGERGAGRRGRLGLSFLFREAA